MFDVHETRYAARIDEFGPGGARPVVTGRRDIPTSKVLTRSGEYVDCEHNVERDFVTIVDLDPRVTRIRHQPHRLSYLWSGQRVSYVPDFELETVSGTYIVEVKTRREYERKEALRERLSQIRQVYESIGLSFFISFDDVIRIEPRFSNLCEMRRYRSTAVSSRDRAAIRDHLARCSSDTLSNCAALVIDSHGNSAVLSLAANHLIDLDMSERISGNTLCRLPHPTV
jgi:hypothetical protein